MRTRQFSSDINTLADKCAAIVKKGDKDGRFMKRIIAVNMFLNGDESIPEIGKSVGASAESVSNWIRKADREGLESLRAKKQSGRPPKLSERQLRELKGEIRRDDPQRYGFDTWNGINVSEFVRIVYGVWLSVRECQYILHSLNFAIIRPQTYPALKNGNETEREEFKQRITDLSNNPNAVLVYQDEVHFKAQTSITGKWAQKGSKPKVMSLPGRNNVSYSGFVIPSTGRLFCTKPNRFNYETTIESIVAFVDACPLESGKKYYLVMDNASWHKKAKRIIFENEGGKYNKILENVVFVTLPAYSPDLNPIEQVWRKTRHDKTHNHYFPDTRVLTNTLDTYFNRFAKPNEELKSLCSFKYKGFSPAA